LKINRVIEAGASFCGLQTTDVPQSHRRTAVVNQYNSLTCHTPSIVTIPVLWGWFRRGLSQSITERGPC